MASIKCGHCQDTHESVAEVRECAEHAKTHGMAAVQKRGSLFTDVPSVPYHLRDMDDESEDQVNRQNGHVPDHSAAAMPMPHRERMAAAGLQSFHHGSGASLRGKKPAAEGIYRKAGSIYKVQIAVHGSGKPYAKRLTETATIDAKTGKPKWKWDYAPGFVNELRPEHLLTLEQAKEFGKLYGVCCVCGAVLTNEESIANGIGPICAQKF